MERLLEAGVPAAPILNYEESLVTEQARAREMVIEIDHPIEGRVKALGFPVKLTGTPQQVRFPAPLLGQHTEEVFEELGVQGDQVKRWREAGAFGPARTPEAA